MGSVRISRATFEALTRSLAEGILDGMERAEADAERLADALGNAITATGGTATRLARQPRLLKTTRPTDE